jgi:hypothetical protein
MPSALGSLTDAGVLGDDQQVVQALGGVGAVEGMAERFRDFAGVVPGGCVRADALAGSEPPGSAPSRGTPAAGHRLDCGRLTATGLRPTAHLAHADTDWFSAARRMPLSLAAPLTQGRLRRWWNRPAGRPPTSGACLQRTSSGADARGRRSGAYFDSTFPTGCWLLLRAAIASAQAVSPG